MTIALAVKVHDGIVLATDSAGTIVPVMPTGSLAYPGVHNVYNNANKLFNLVKGLPIGCMTWGTGSIGFASISTLAKDFRTRLTEAPPPSSDWHLDPKNYSIFEVAQKLRRFLQGERQHLIHLPHGLIVMSYLRSDGERSIRASYGSISFFESRMPLR